MLLYFLLSDTLLPEDLPIAATAALSDDDPGGESFEKLFEAMMEMKGPHSCINPNGG